MDPAHKTDSPAIRLVMMPRDTNPQGAIFGGVILSLIDQAAFVEALHTANRRYVTVAMNAIEFKKPVLVGDVLSLWAETTQVGRTSIRVHIDVCAQRMGHEEQIHVTQADVVLVAVDDAGAPVPIRND